MLSLQVAADDEAQIFLNGNLVGSVAASGYTSLHPFTINSGFVSGTNTLSFSVTNSGSGPTGLLVTASGTAAAIPEPASMTVFALVGAAAGVGYLRRRKPVVV